MYNQKYETFEGKTLRIANCGTDREDWSLYRYSIYDEGYEVFETYSYDSDLDIAGLPEHYKKIIRFNLKFKDIAKISNQSGNLIYIKNRTADNFIDWLLYLDEYCFRDKLNIEKITITQERRTSDPSYTVEYNSYDDRIYNATVITKSPYQNVVNTRLKNVLSILRQAYCKYPIDILVRFREGDKVEYFTIEVDSSGHLDIAIRRTELTLVPGGLPEDVINKINQLKTL